jgi:hypothetical protein
MRCSFCFRPLRVGTRAVRVVRPVCFECARSPRFAVGWRGVLVVALVAGLVMFHAGRWFADR